MKTALLFIAQQFEFNPMITSVFIIFILVTVIQVLKSLVNHIESFNWTAFILLILGSIIFFIQPVGDFLSTNESDIFGLTKGFVVASSFFGLIVSILVSFFSYKRQEGASKFSFGEIL